jgi:hypothetical protein
MVMIPMAHHMTTPVAALVILVRTVVIVSTLILIIVLTLVMSRIVALVVLIGIGRCAADKRNSNGGNYQILHGGSFARICGG